MKCPHCHHEFVREKSHVIQHGGQMISMRELSRRSGISYSTLQSRYDRGLRGEGLLGPIDMRRSTTKATPKSSQRPPLSEISGLMGQFMSGGAR